MSQKRRVPKFALALAAVGALSLSTWTSAEARPFGLLLGGGLHHLGGLGGGFRPLGLGGGLRGGAFGFRQPGFGYSGFRQAGLGYRGFASAGGSRGWRGGPGRGRYWGAYGAAAVGIGAVGAYSNGYSTTGSDSSGYYGYPAYGY